MTKIIPPTNCPSCGSELKWSNHLLYCTNSECKSKVAKTIEHFAKTLKIKGLGPATIAKLNLADISEIYLHTKESIAEALNSDKLAEKLVYEIAYDYISEKVKRYYRDKKIIVDREIKLFTEKDEVLTQKLLGSILLQIESKGEAWYLNPEDQKKYYMGSPFTAYREIKEFSVQIDNEAMEDYLFEKTFPKKIWSNNKGKT